MNKKEAIFYIEELQKTYASMDKKVAEAVGMAIDMLKSERPKSEWIVYPLVDDGRVELECPECGDTFIQAVDYKPNFCENCGTDMR